MPSCARHWGVPSLGGHEPAGTAGAHSTRQQAHAGTHLPLSLHTRVFHVSCTPCQAAQGTLAAKPHSGLRGGDWDPEA